MCSYLNQPQTLFRSKERLWLIETIKSYLLQGAYLV